VSAVEDAQRGDQPAPGVYLSDALHGYRGLGEVLPDDEVQFVTPAGDVIVVRLQEDGSLRVMNRGQRRHASALDADGLGVHPVASNVLVIRVAGGAA
jgi:hypothetical protein